MSSAEVERFVADLMGNEDLRNELSGHASGVGSVVAFAKDKGYDVSADEAAAYIHDQAGRELNDAELDAVAGGKSGSLNQGVSTTVVAATAVSTTTAQSAWVEAVIGTTTAAVTAAVVTAT